MIMLKNKVLILSLIWAFFSFSIFSVNAFDTTSSQTLDEQVKEKQLEMRTILDKDQVTKQIEETQKETIAIDIKEQNLNELKQDIKQTIDSLKTDIQEKETLKVKLDLEQEKTEEVKSKISTLESEINKLKKLLSDKEKEYNDVVPKLQSETSVLKQENQLALEQLVSLKQERTDIEQKELRFNLLLLLSVYWLFIIFRILAPYIQKKYHFEEYDQYLQVFYIFSVIFLTLFSIVMIFVINKELLVSLFFLGWAIILTLKEYSLSFLASIISVKSFSLGDYLTVNWKTWIVSRLGLLSFAINIVDKYWNKTEEYVRVSNSILLGDKEIVGTKNFYIKEEIKIKDVTKFKNWFLWIKHLIEGVFLKYNIQKFELVDLFEETHWLSILWSQEKNLATETKGLVLSKLSELEYNQYIFDVKKDIFLENKDTLLLYNYKVEKKDELYRLYINVLKSQESTFLKDREKFLI